MKNKITKVVVLSAFLSVTTMVCSYASSDPEGERVGPYALVPVCAASTDFCDYLSERQTRARMATSDVVTIMQDSMILLGMGALNPKEVHDGLVSASDAVFMAYLGIAPRFGELRAQTSNLQHGYMQLVVDTVDSLNQMKIQSGTMKATLREYVSDLFEFGAPGDARGTVDKILALANRMASACGDLSKRYGNEGVKAATLAEEVIRAQGASDAELRGMRGRATDLEGDAARVRAANSVNQERITQLDQEIAQVKEELSKLHEDQRGLMAVFKEVVGVVKEGVKAAASAPMSAVKAVGETVRSAFGGATKEKDDSASESAVRALGSLTDQVKVYSARIQALEEERSRRMSQKADDKGKLAEAALVLSRIEELSTDMAPAIQGLAIATDQLRSASSHFKSLESWWVRLRDSIQGTADADGGVLTRPIRLGERALTRGGEGSPEEIIWRAIGDSEKQGVGVLYMKYNALEILMGGLQGQLEPVARGSLTDFGSTITGDRALVKYRELANTIADRLKEESARARRLALTAGK